MDIKRTRSVYEVLYWTRGDILLLIILAAFPTLLYLIFEWKWIALPWLPIALVGTAVSFIIGFKNNASYNRAWEARRIWGSIINSSRSLLSAIINYIEYAEIPAEEKQQIYLRTVNRQVAWLTALRYQLREPKQWESANKWYNAEFKKNNYSIDEHTYPITEVLKAYLSDEEFDYTMLQHNKPAQILAFHSKEIAALQHFDLINTFQQVDLQNIVKELYDHQGGSERIKNFPYPRQYATLNLFFIRLFTFLLPFGMLHQFEDLLGTEYIWLTIPFAVLIGWVFTTMEKMGEASENPFEGSNNDIPITQISRNIEIDLLEMIRQPHNLKPKQAQNEVLT